MQNPTASSRKEETTNPRSDLYLEQVKSQRELKAALSKGGAALALVKQKRNKTAKALRGTFEVIKGGLY